MMRSRRDYPASVASVLRPDARFNPAALRAVRAFKRARPWSGDREAKLRELNAALATAYGIPAPHLLLYNGRSSRSSYYSPLPAHTIVLSGHSVVTYLHEFAHARGWGERAACRWSLNLFRRVFPCEFARCAQRGHILVREVGG